MKKILLLFIIMGLLLPELRSQFKISGQVSDNFSGKALSHVNVSFDKLSAGTITDSTGYFELILNQTGSYYVNFSHVGYYPVRKKIHIKGTNNKHVNIYLRSKAIQLKQTVITATRTQREIAELPVRTCLVTPFEISDYPANTTDELLRSVAGIVINRSWGIFSKNTSVTMRGLEGSSRTLILLDGVPINKTAGGSVTWEMIKPEQIESIEIVKGPHSALYGNNAMAGVINIKSKRPVKKLGGYISGMGGSLGVWGGSAGLSTDLRKGQKGQYYMANGSYRKGEGYVLEPLETRDSNSANAYLKDYNTHILAGYQFNRNHKLEGEYLHFFGKHGSGKKIFEDGGSFDLYQVNFSNVKYQGTWENVQLISKVFYQQEDYDNQKESVNSTGVYKLSETFSHKKDYGIWTGISFSFSENHGLTTGFDFKHGQLDSKLVYRTSPDVLKNFGDLDFFGLFVQDEIKMFKKRLHVIAGFRFDWARFYNGGLQVQDPTSATGFIQSIENDFGNHSWGNLSPKLALLFDLTEGMSTFLSVSSGFMPPKLDDLTRSGKITKGFKLANPKLKPETITSYEWGLNYEPWGTWRLESSVYLSHGKDFQYFLGTGDSIDTGGSSLKPVLQRQNISEIQVLGFEMTSVWQPLSQIKIIGAYAYNHSTIKHFHANAEFNKNLTGKYLIEVPKNQVSLTLFLKSRILNASLVYSYMGSQWYNDENTRKIDAFSLIDLEISKTLFHKLIARITIQDLLNRQFVDRKGRLSPGRFVIGQLMYTI